jgi:DNA-binding XRE family transcriptional regulator
VSRAGSCLAYVADELERGLSLVEPPLEAPTLFWERPGGLELELASFDPVHQEFLIWFKAGARFRLPAKALQDTGEVLAVQLDEYRHGVLVAFSDGRATSFASDFVLFTCEPEYQAAMTAKPHEASVGAKIRALRVASHRAASDVAAAAGMAPSNFARLEAGRHRPRIDTLVRIAAALDVPLARLFQPPP